MTDRATGKTFRAILRGLLRASAGDSVAIVSNREEECEAKANLAAAMAKDHAIDCARTKIIFPNGGTLRFTTHNAIHDHLMILDCH